MRAFRCVSIAVMVVGVAACDGPASPCADAECAANGGAAELSVASVTMQAVERDTDTGLLVVVPDAIDVRVVVRNEGNAPSIARQLVVSVGSHSGQLATVPALAAGAEDVRVVRLNRPAVAFLTDTDTMHATAAVVVVDSNPENNERASAPFHLAMPALRITTAVSSHSLRANEGTASTITVRNVSQHAGLQASTLAHCIYDPGGRCTGVFNATAFGQLSLPALGRGATHVLNSPVSVPSDASNQNFITLSSLGTCIAAGDVNVNDMPVAGVCMDVAQVTVRPDYEACSPLLLEPDAPGRATPVCRRPCEIYVYAVNVEPGHTYRVLTADGSEDKTLRWRTRYRDAPIDASRAPGFQPATSGKLYLSPEPKFCGAAGDGSVTLRVE